MTIALVRLVAAAVLALASPALAETAAQRAACTPSVIHLCPAQALAGDREGAKACLLRRLDHASPRCQAAVRAPPTVTPPLPTKAGSQG